MAWTKASFYSGPSKYCWITQTTASCAKKTRMKRKPTMKTRRAWWTWNQWRVKKNPKAQNPSRNLNRCRLQTQVTATRATNALRCWSKRFFVCSATKRKPLDTSKTIPLLISSSLWIIVLVCMSFISRSCLSMMICRNLLFQLR